ncbi:Clan CA, family C19, ubiquitin hydrolase-like cysteine peptidase [Trichomonas vaginalis G3]|uniref:ubiquitinyl hydrolase 1 n=1 Tax=Trichomonas vaginalis (strain ATCC PRA-98 / G3) TaxID=412133 RepID=A2F0I3_TRIV3|nr:ubiquitin carboxyl-terminal hydrolase family [Trichomonas vaginalis G3]EAY01563.1 Clan CA, family C19, ubiquitin hydrolase-like cysteine peptidase [Trichomonas vaginalis G3]KAI5529825.1 ubiquitin carboxyl-terminal hydrolase family [Trichomonas vaginalis G3]|eukprot:XP_001314204.1 Clan CA, family C19, ubiquitin hydrolase-like cysteine peptidase [Trichomonas vaginalis G3]
MSIPTKEEQAERLKNLERTSSISVEDGAYIISAKWMINYKAAIGFNQFDPANVEVGPIDNSEIADPENKSRVAKTKGENTDFYIVDKTEWDVLYGWYGCNNIIKLEVVMDEVENKPISIVYYQKLTVVYGEEKKDIEVHKYMYAKDILAKARELFNIPADKQLQLIDYLNGNYVALMDEDSYLKRYNLIDGQLIAVNYKDENDEWKIKKPTQVEYLTKLAMGSTPTTAASTTMRSRYGYDEGKPGRHGFNNLGNTCYFNSGTQCLMHTMPLIQYFVDGRWEQWINRENKLGSHGCLATAFNSICQQMWSDNTSGAIRPSELKAAIGGFNSRFSGYEQHDSHELILFMLDGIHEDLNRCKVKPQVEPVIGDGANDEAIADESWKRCKLRNDSIIVDHFYGLLRSQLLCPNCQKTTVVFDPFLTVELPLARENERKIHVSFIPKDIKAKWTEFNINIRTSEIANVNLISKLVSEKLGKEVLCIPAALNTENFSIKFGFPDTYESRLQAVVFEIDSQDKFYVPVLIVGSVASQYNPNYFNAQPITPPFLIEVDDLSLEEDKYKDIVLERLKPVLDTKSEIELTEDAKNFLARIKKEPEEGQEAPEFAVNFQKDYWKNVQSPKPSKHVKCASANGVVVTADISKLDMNVLVQNVPSNAYGYSSKHTSTDTIPLDRCFNLFSTVDTLDEQNQWHCPHCGQFVCADKKMEIWRCPEVLVIHLKRFSGEGYYVKKDSTLVDFPEELDMAPYIRGKTDQSTHYKLYAVSEHMGSMGGGHYIAHAIVNGKWYKFDDSSCYESSYEDAKSPLAYVLFYQRIDK